MSPYDVSRQQLFWWYTLDVVPQFSLDVVSSFSLTYILIMCCEHKYDDFKIVILLHKLMPMPGYILEYRVDDFASKIVACSWNKSIIYKPLHHRRTERDKKNRYECPEQACRISLVVAIPVPKWRYMETSAVLNSKVKFMPRNIPVRRWNIKKIPVSIYEHHHRMHLFATIPPCLLDQFSIKQVTSFNKAYMSTTLRSRKTFDRYIR